MDKPNPQNNSYTVQIYYKGYSILLTERGEGEEIAVLLVHAKAVIDKVFEMEDFAPSWNKQTNKEYDQLSTAQANTKWMGTTSSPVPLGSCPKCGSPMKISSKGKPYCSALCWKK